MKKIYDAAIIGGGISGLSCAHELSKNNINFILISPKLGGRMQTYGSNNMGADYFCKLYHHIKPYVKKKGPLPVYTYNFWDGKGYSNYFNMRHWVQFSSVLKLYFILKKYVKELDNTITLATQIGCTQSLLKNKFLLKLWNTSAIEFIQKNKLEKFENTYGRAIVNSTFFCKTEDLNAFHYLGNFIPLAVPSYEIDFKRTIEHLTKGYHANISYEKAVKIKKGKINTVFTNKSPYKTKNIVIAAPYNSMKKLFPELPKPDGMHSCFIHDVSGKLKKQFNKKKVIIFDPKKHPIGILWKQFDGSYIVSSYSEKPKLKDYFNSFKIKKTVHWNPAIIANKGNLISERLSSNIFIASDYNISGLEISAINGLYAANEIIKNTESKS
uniref:Protoporphyrinogen oxidase n=1 Tax=uncultured marine group II/III euryarchaeote KM3_83_G03 TaxID=1456522 RepID=A0A075HVU2_9EURY|nr:protoporphyrinogen oxidase [uncultured marine group II/III euryarchaeote KM3_83_G03]